MSKIKVGIIDTDNVYAGRLSAYIRDRENDRMEAHLFKDTEQLKDSLDELDMILVGDKVEGALELSKQSEKVIILGNETSESATRNIGRYQKAKVMLAEAMNKLALESRVSATGQLIAVCSPAHHELQMFFSMCMARELSASSRVLYVNLLGYSGFSGFFGAQEGDDLEDLLLWSKRASFNLGNHVIQVQGVDLVLPPRRPEVLWEMGEADFEDLLAALSSGPYDTVLFDVGPAFPGTFHLLQECKKVFVLGRDGYLADRVYEEWKASLLFHLGTDINEKLTYVCPGMLGSNIAERELLLEELYRGNLGDYVRGILEDKNERSGGGNPQSSSFGTGFDQGIY